MPPTTLLAIQQGKHALLDELKQSWEAGAPARLEDLLGRWPTQPKDDPDVASLLFEDWRQQRRHGKEASLDKYEQRFPEHCAIRSVLSCISTT